MVCARANQSRRTPVARNFVAIIKPGVDDSGMRRGLIGSSALAGNSSKMSALDRGESVLPSGVCDYRDARFSGLTKNNCLSHDRPMAEACIQRDGIQSKIHAP
jgi:hypothetical protein